MFPKFTETKCGEKLTIREASKEDAPALIEHVNEVAGETDFLTCGVGDFKMTVKEEGEILEEYKQAENRIFLVAELHNEIVGILTINAGKKPRLRHIGVFGLTVRKKHWGKAVGSNLISVMFEWARAFKIIRKINLSVQINNKAAIAIYDKFGFEKEGVIRRDSFVEGKFYDAYAMGILID